MKRIALDRKHDRIKKFVRSLAVESDGSVLELQGKPVLRVLPPTEQPVDHVQLKAAIMKRRDVSRRLNADWETVDREIWQRTSRPKS